MEADFSGKTPAVEINRLGEEIKQLVSEREELRSNKDKLEAEVQRLKDASQPTPTSQATYPLPAGSGVPPGSTYGATLPSHAQMLGQYSPNFQPYGMAATQVAYAGPGGQAQSYGLPQQPSILAHQFQGSPQAQQVAMNLFRPAVGQQQIFPLAQGSDVSSQAIISTPVTTSAPST